MSSATIRDVAKLAGVSIKTVSRVVNKDPTVKERNRTLVEDAIVQLSYQPNLAARMLRSARSYLIALLYEHPDSRNLAKIQASVLQRCRLTGHHLVIERVESVEPERIAKASSLIRNSSIEGVILLPPISEDVELLQFFVDMGVPSVRIGPAMDDLPPMPSVSMDDRLAAKAVTLKLAELGHARIAFIESLLTHPTSRSRLEGYLEGLVEAKLPYDPALVAKVHPPLTVTAGSAAAAQLLKVHPCPTAIFAHNDDLAVGALLKAEQLGLRIPQDLSIFGFDDSYVAPLVKPPLSSVRQPVDEMADTATILLLEQIEKKASQPTAMTLADYELILRGSTGLAPTVPGS